jgi:hypothetical protein
MSTIPNIPDFFVLKGVRPGGVRLPKFPKYVPIYTQAPITQARINFGGRFGIGDKLTHGDLRYWCGQEGELNPEYGSCRACGEVLFTTKDRKEHSRLKGCGRVLTEAFKALLRDRKCVICDQETRKTCWGIPICSTDCTKEWCYVTRCSAALHYAIDYIKLTVKI